jgi:hypothetical protein
MFTKKFAGLFAGILTLCASSLMAQTSIVGSQHDLSPGGTGQGTSASDEVCVFCHTPHAADISTPALPLWNKTLPSPATYTRYSATGTPSFDSAEADVGSVSLACLSCHDGSQAMDTVINLPGSGGYNPAGTVIGGTGIMTGAPIPMLGVDLSDDHPISIPYGAGGAVSGDTDGTFAGPFVDPDFKSIEKATLNLQPIWWVDTIDGGAAGVREKKDLPLYARSDLGQLEPFIECGSCHDPHNAGSKSVVAPLTVAFLRTDDNAGSKICVACHDK